MKYAMLLIIILTGCAKTPQIDPDLRVRMNRFVEKERVRKPYVVRANIVSMREMPEEAATAIWLETGLYRGLTDLEWVNLMILIQEEGK